MTYAREQDLQSSREYVFTAAFMHLKFRRECKEGDMQERGSKAGIVLQDS